MSLNAAPGANLPKQALQDAAAKRHTSRPDAAAVPPSLIFPILETEKVKLYSLIVKMVIIPYFFLHIEMQCTIKISYAIFRIIV